MNGPRRYSEHYSPQSYYSLGRVSPRDRLREPFPQRRQRYPTAYMRYVLGPYCVCDGEIYLDGSDIGQALTDGQAAEDTAAEALGDVYVDGSGVGQIGCDC